jgi:hypothetical protein
MGMDFSRVVGECQSATHQFEFGESVAHVRGNETRRKSTAPKKELMLPFLDYFF